MNLDELQSVQARERQSSDLQHLRSSFYREVGEFIRELTEERARIVERADDPFSSPEVRQLTDDIETAEQTVEAIYERRVGKVVKKASIAAAGMPVDDDGLTAEEEDLFEDLVDRIEANRETVLSVLDGDAPSVSCSIDGEEEASSDDARPADPGTPPGLEDQPGAETPDDGGGVSAADLMGGADESSADGAASERSPSDPASEPPVDEASPAEGSTPEPPSADPLAAESDADDPGGSPTEVPPEPGPPGESPPGGTGESGDPEEDAATDERPAPTSSERDVPGIPRTTVRITADVGEVVGADDRDYELGPEDVVTLPEPNAEVLVEKDAAERLE